MKEAQYWQREGEKIRCQLCPHYCLVADGQKGRCGVRENRGNKLYALNYGQIGALALDPVEKKPLFRFKPGSMILSVGTTGCNLDCAFCQNWELVSGRGGREEISPEELVALAENYRPVGNIGLAYTYSEPLMWFEFILATAKLAREKGLANVLVSNGFINSEPWRELLPWLDAVNIDIKGEKEFYRKLCKARPEPVWRAVEMAVKAGIHVEITCLLVTDENDSPEQIEALARRLADLSSKIPLHLSRYFPRRSLTAPPTPLERMYEAQAIASRYLKYVYLGNLP
ncbi:MAG: AmmeMemoRadiSam system radical SAM enzyme [Bacillota bacterium]